MKNSIVFSLLILAFLFSCENKKEEISPVRNDIRIHIIFGYNETSIYGYAEGAEVKVYDEKKSLVGTYYTNAKGFCTLNNINTDQTYKFTFVTRTYSNCAVGCDLYHYEALDITYDNTRITPERLNSVDYAMYIRPGIGEQGGPGIGNGIIIQQ